MSESSVKARSPSGISWRRRSTTRTGATTRAGRPSASRATSSLLPRSRPPSRESSPGNSAARCRMWRDSSTSSRWARGRDGFSRPSPRPSRRKTPDLRRGCAWPRSSVPRNRGVVSRRSASPAPCGSSTPPTTSPKGPFGAGSFPTSFSTPCRSLGSKDPRDALHELRVGIAEERFAWVRGSGPGRLAGASRVPGVKLADGQAAEISPDAAPLYRHLARALTGGRARDVRLRPSRERPLPCRSPARSGTLAVHSGRPPRRRSAGASRREVDLDRSRQLGRARARG